MFIWLHSVCIAYLFHLVNINLILGHDILTLQFPINPFPAKLHFPSYFNFHPLEVVHNFKWVKTIRISLF